MNHASRLLAGFALGLSLGLIAPQSPAQSFPTKPIHLVVPLAPGGGTDFWARFVGAKMGEALGQQIIIENRPGGGTIIAAEAVAKSAADGYTILLATSTTLAYNPSLYKKLSYDPEKDFAPVTLTTRMPMLLIAAPAFPANTAGEFIALARSKPGQMDYASAGLGSPQHLAMALLMQKTGLKLNNVVYNKGDAPVLQDLMGGRVPVAFVALPSVPQLLKAGKIKALAVTSATRVGPLPNLQTVSESGVPGYEADIWQGLVVPAGTPNEVVAKINAAHASSVADPDVKRRLFDFGMDPIPGSPQQFAAYIHSEIAKWGKLIRDYGIKTE